MGATSFYTSRQKRLAYINHDNVELFMDDQCSTYLWFHWGKSALQKTRHLNITIVWLLLPCSNTKIFSIYLYTFYIFRESNSIMEPYNLMSVSFFNRFLFFTVCVNKSVMQALELMSEFRSLFVCFCLCYHSFQSHVHLSSN